MNTNTVSLTTNDMRLSSGSIALTASHPRRIWRQGLPTSPRQRWRPASACRPPSTASRTGRGCRRRCASASTQTRRRGSERARMRAPRLSPLTERRQAGSMVVFGLHPLISVMLACAMKLPSWLNRMQGEGAGVAARAIPN
eukprot:5153726-Pleurochrysis_carterae.AAC.5